MRRFMLALMILLLPLRGWMGDAMGTEMGARHMAGPLGNTFVAMKTIATYAHETAATGHFHHDMAAPQATEPSRSVRAAHDCTGHGAQEVSRANDADASADSCGTCQACQACHTVALSQRPMGMTAVFSPLMLPTLPAARFASADAALGQKPPIS